MESNIFGNSMMGFTMKFISFRQKKYLLLSLSLFLQNLEIIGVDLGIDLHLRVTGL
jgi:hypothetical protein